MANGLKMNLDEFESMNFKQQRAAIFHNTEQILSRVDDLNKVFLNHEKKDTREFSNINYKLTIIFAILFGIVSFLGLTKYILPLWGI